MDVSSGANSPGSFQRSYWDVARLLTVALFVLRLRMYPFTAVIMSLLGVEFWPRWWMHRGNYGLILALPGLFLGYSAYGLLQIGLSEILLI